MITKDSPKLKFAVVSAGIVIVVANYEVVTMAFPASVRGSVYAVEETFAIIRSQTSATLTARFTQPEPV